MLHQGKDKNMNKLRNAEGYRVRRAGVTACLVLSIVCAAFAPAVHAQQNEVARAEQLMREGKPADAYALLTPLEDKYAGDVQFDYALGVAALDSGKADRATLAFERVLAVNPNYAGARLDMARAYFQLGDAERAKTEFLAVQASRPPAEAAAVITRYLDAIDQSSVPSAAPCVPMSKAPSVMTTTSTIPAPWARSPCPRWVAWCLRSIHRT